jgi:S-adenosylmethionine synthetase
VQTFGTAKVPEVKLERAVREVFPLRPGGIIQCLRLLRPIYEATSAYGHFGRTSDLDVFTWEKTDRVKALQAAI